MMKLSRGVLAAIAVAAAIPATYAVAKGVEHARWQQMSPETRARLDEGRLAMIKTALKLTPDQEKLWSPIEAQIRDTFKAREAKRAEHEAMRAEHDKNRADGKKSDLSERFEKMSKAMSERASRMSAFSGAFKPFYAALSDEQKEVLRPLIRNLAPGMGRGGHGHHFAEGGGGRGWGFGGGWGGGRHGGGHHGHHGGGMMDGERGGGGGAGGPDKGPSQAPQNAPDIDSDEGDAPPAGQKL